MVHNPDRGDTLRDQNLRGNFLETGGGDGSSDFPVGFICNHILQICVFQGLFKAQAIATFCRLIVCGTGHLGAVPVLLEGTTNSFNVEFR